MWNTHITDNSITNFRLQEIFSEQPDFEFRFEYIFLEQPNFDSRRYVLLQPIWITFLQDYY